MAAKQKRNAVTHRTPAQAKAHDRGYKSSPVEKAKRARRDKIRAKLQKSGRVTAGKRQSIDHKTPMSKGGSDSPSNLRITTISKNSAHGLSPGGHGKKKAKR